MHCPVCGEVADSLITSFRDRQGIAVRNLIMRDDRSWKPGTGCCHTCFVSRDLPRSTSRINRDHGPFAVLPVPLRVNADPRFRGGGVTIAFIDSGFFPHPELKNGVNRILRMSDVTSDRGGEAYFRFPHPESWHGTMSSVIASGSGSLSNSFYRGIADEARIVCIKVFNRKARRITESDIARGIRWAIDNRARFNIRILNISVGGDSPKPLSASRVDRLVEEAFRKGILTVVAAGNTPGNPVLPPASAPSALTVGGYDDHDQLDRNRWSMYPTTWGLTEDGRAKPDMLGPAGSLPGPLLPRTDQADEAGLLFSILSASKSAGVRILREKKALLRTKPGQVTLQGIQTWVRDQIADAKYISRCHKKMEGTSVAASVISSVAAQMLEANPLLGPGDLRSMLLKSSVPLHGVSSGEQGSGILNARGAVSLALLARHDSQAPGAHVRKDHIVLLYSGSTENSLHLAGDFNGWDANATPFQRLDDGRWSCLIPCPPEGADAYKLVCDGTRWIPDPTNQRRTPDGFGGWNTRFPHTRD